MSAIFKFFYENFKKEKESLLKYTEIQEYLGKMQKPEIIKNLKLIVHIYKRMLNEKHINPLISTIEEQVCNETA